MKNTLYIFIAVLITSFFACGIVQEKERKFHIESEVSFFDLRNGNLLENNWIRKPANMLMVHETFKKYGYVNLLHNLWLGEHKGVHIGGI